MCAEAGLTPAEFLDMTITEIARHWNGYTLRNARQWEIARMEMYVGALPYMKVGERPELYDFLPLSTDPTKEERAIMKEKAFAKQRAEIEEVFKYYESLGFKVR
jgi:hypothetical protein